MKRLTVIILGIFVLFTGCEEYDPREPGLLVPMTVDEDSSIPSISVNNTMLHAESFGNPDDPMIVVLHGGPGSDYRYLLNCKEFSDYGYHVVFYDQRGSGLSKRENKSAYSLQIMLDDLSAVIEFYRSSPEQKITLLGHSWGAMLATAYINQFPNAIDGAILCEPGGFVWKDIKDYVSRVRGFGITSEILNDATYLDQFITGKETDHEKLDYKFGLSTVTDGSEDNPVGDIDDVPFWRLGAIVNRAMFEIGERVKPDWTGNLNSFNTKVLFVYSERNRAYGTEYAQHVSSAYPNVQLVRIDGAGHEMITFPTGWNNFFPIALNYINEIK
ncbi:MAG TPA: alpha/beta hydrolase [Cyclobacteriaceae bacterium]|nr:alpha/beta hydrolase [Cyclobacteriaceae bacterium]